MKQHKIKYEKVISTKRRRNSIKQARYKEEHDTSKEVEVRTTKEERGDSIEKGEIRKWTIYGQAEYERANSVTSCKQKWEKLGKVKRAE